PSGDLGRGRLDCLSGRSGGRVLGRVRGGAARFVTGAGLGTSVHGEVSTRGRGGRPADVTSPAPGGIPTARTSRGWRPGRVPTPVRTVTRQTGGAGQRKSDEGIRWAQRDPGMSRSLSTALSRSWRLPS